MEKQSDGLNLQKLTPSNIENMSYYKQSLDFMFKNPDILNIAITGGYGAGKSSVIKTYKNLHKEKKFIHISLTNFGESELEQDGDIRKQEDNRVRKLDESELEGKILNQLIYQINPRKIQQTKFKIKTDISITSIIKETLVAVTFLLFFLYTFKFKELQLYIDNLGSGNIIKYLNILTNKTTLILSTTVCLIIFAFYLFRIIKGQLYNSIFKRIKLKGGEIEIFEDDKESYFNKHIDEILYLFRNADADAIVFEDIDRYNNNVIFSKLREINNLINSEINNEDKNRPIRFLYLIRDDIFTSKDRTKFFDLILPIVPVIDSSNSYDKILEYFGQGRPLNSAGKVFLSELDDFFLRDISLYIDDMRLLKNIYNEYVIYYGRLQITDIGLDFNRLLSLIIYKNIFPKDFIELQLNKGFVYNIFNNKDSYIKNKKNEIGLEIFDKQESIKAIKDEQLDDIDELDTLYLTSGHYNYRVNNKFDDGFKTRLEYIKEMKKEDSNVQEYSGYSSRTFTKYDMKNQIEEFSNRADYTKRKDLIKQKMYGKVEKIEREIIELELDKEHIGSLKIKELIDKDYINIKELLEYGLRNDKGKLTKYGYIINDHYYPLIIYLIKTGQIDETYPDYLSYFYENGLTRNDKIFLRSVTDVEAKEFNYKLNDPTKVITYMKPKSLGQKEALNFNLLEFLLNNRSLKNNKKYLLYNLQYIRDNKRFDFVWEYIIQSSDKEKFVKELNIVWQELWVYLTGNSDVEDKKKKDYMVYTINYSDIVDIKNMNIKFCITNYISSNEKFLDINEPNIDKIINTFISLEVSFTNINYSISNKCLFEEVYKNDLYELNFKMITLILKKIYGIPYTSDYTERNYTLVSCQSNQPLKDYVDKNINEYMELLFDNLSTRFTDPLKYVLNILNSSDIKDEIKVRYIKNLSTIIMDIKEIEDQDLWEELFKNNIVNYSSKNILNYYFKYSGMIDSTIAEYLNINRNEIQFEYKIIEENHGEETINFFKKVIKNSKLTNEKYEMILKGFNRSINNFDINGIDEDKLEILIKLSIIGMSKENIEFVREGYPDLIIFFITRNIQDYINCLDEEIILEQEILDLLIHNDIPEEYKINLAEAFPGNITIEDSNYSENLQLYIIENKFENSDLNYLVDKYDSYSYEMKQVIEEICKNYINVISINKYKLSYDLLLDLMAESSIDDSYKKNILCNNIDDINGIKAKKLMSIAKLYEFESLFERRRPKIEITDENYELLKCFEAKGWITKFEEDKNSDGYYRAYGRDYNRIRKKAISDILL